MKIEPYFTEADVARAQEILDIKDAATSRMREADRTLGRMYSYEESAEKTQAKEDYEQAKRNVVELNTRFDDEIKALTQKKDIQKIIDQIMMGLQPTLNAAPHLLKIVRSLIVEDARALVDAVIEDNTLFEVADDAARIWGRLKYSTYCGYINSGFSPNEAIQLVIADTTLMNSFFSIKRK